MRRFYECGICGAFHPADWDGDCRDDRHRFEGGPEELNALFGEGWEEVDMDDVSTSLDPMRFIGEGVITCHHEPPCRK